MLKTPKKDGRDLSRSNRFCLSKRIPLQTPRTRSLRKGGYRPIRKNPRLSERIPLQTLSLRATRRYLPSTTNPNRMPMSEPRTMSLREISPSLQRAKDRNGLSQTNRSVTSFRRRRVVKRNTCHQIG